MSRKYNKTFTSLKTVVHDTSILDAQKILVKVPDNSSNERTDIIDYINESINNTNENIDTINAILGNKIFESSEKSTATTVIEWDAIHYKDATAVPHNTDIVLITLIPQNTNISVKTYLAAWYVNSSNEKTWLGMSDNGITWEEGKKATWTFSNNPLNVPDNCKLELFLTTSILNNPSGDPSHPGVYFASKASDNKQATHRYEDYWDTYGGTPYTIFNSSSLISNEDVLESIDNAVDGILTEGLQNKFANKTITETTLGEIGYTYELAADAAGDGECDAIHYAANKIPHNIVIDEIRIPTLNNSPKPLYLAVWIINQSNVKTYIGLSDSTATWSEGGIAIWKFTHNPINVPENYRLELFLAEAAPASSAIEIPASTNYIKVFVNYSGSGTVRHNGGWNGGRDIRTIFVKNGIVVNHEERISILEEKTLEGVGTPEDTAKLNEANVFTANNTFNGGMISNGDIVLNGSKLLLANGAAVEIYQGTDIPLPEGGGNSSNGNSSSIDTSNFAKLNEDNIFTGNNNFAGNLTLNDKSILTADDLSNYVTNDILSNKNYLTSSALTDYAKKTDLSSYATTASLSSYLKSSDIGTYIIESWDNGNNWCRKYSDGRMEQGGEFKHTTSGGSELYTAITLPTAFYDKSYDILIQTFRSNSITDYSSLYAGSFLRTSTSSFEVRLVAANGSQYIDGFVWRASGRWAANN